MGLTHQELLAKASARSRRKAVVEFLIDSGVAYSLVPASVLKKLGVRPHRELGFTLADGTTIKRHVGDAYFELNGEGSAAPVIFGERDDEPLWGATTLEGIGLVLDPLSAA
jgi:clan AA aspartic protease